MSWMDQIIAPYLSSPLANSTKIYNNVYTNGPDISLTQMGYRNTSYRPIPIVTAEESDTQETESSTTPNISTASTDTSTSCSNNSNTKESSPKATNKSVGCKKPVVSRKSMTAKKTVEPIKAVANNCKKSGVTVEKILKQINMTKYQQSFKKIDVPKFKALREIDLNAIGITRPSEIRTFMDAIKKTKSDTFIIKQN